MKQQQRKEKGKERMIQLVERREEKREVKEQREEKREETEKREEKEKREENEKETETETTDHKQVQGTDQQSVTIIA